MTKLILIFAVFSAVTLNAQTPESASGWMAKQTWSGDLRYRVVHAKEHVDDPRLYQQLRARLGLRADVNENVQAVIRLMTYTSAISGNQTLGDKNDPGMVRRSFGLDWGYIDWDFAPGAQVWAGRTASPFWSPNKAQLIFDGDLAFEGVALKWEPQWSASSMFVNVAGYMIGESYDVAGTAAPGQKLDDTDIGLLAAQAGFTFKSEDWSWTLLAGSYTFPNVKNKYITMLQASAKTDAYSGNTRYLGNTVNTDNGKYRFATQFSVAELGTEWRHKLAGLEYFVFGDFVRNTAVADMNYGHEYGAGLKWKILTVSVAEILKSSDAVVAAFTDSDTNGGGTDNRGLRFQLGLQLGKNVTFTVTHHVAKRGIDSFERNFSSTLADLQASF